MVKTMHAGWRKLLLILTVLPCCMNLEVFIPEREYEVARGGDITLTCSFKPAQPKITTLVLKWESDPDKIDDPMEPVATYFLNNPVNIAPAYEGKASMEVDLNTRVSTLRLTKVTMQDSRRFQCSVTILNDDEGNTAAATSLLVLVAPSKPICRIQGEAEYWHDIGLTCMSEEGSPQPIYEWKSYSVQNAPRTFPPKTTEKDGVLSLFNISKEMSGFYICTSTNRIGSESCNFTLAVVPGGGMKAGSIAAVVGGVLACLLLLGIVVYCCRRKKAKKQKYNEDAPGEMEFSDKDAPVEVEEQGWEEKSNSETKQPKQYEDKDAASTKNSTGGPGGQRLEDDQRSYSSGKERNGGKGDIDSQRYRDDPHDHYRGSRDQLDKKGKYEGGSRERLEDPPNRYDSASRDRLDKQPEHYRGSRDRLDDPRDNYRGSRDRLDDSRDNYRGSRDRLDDPRDGYRGSRDRLDDPRDGNRGSRDRLDDPRDHYRGSRDRLDYRDDQYRD